MKRGSFIPNDPESRRKADETFRKLSDGVPVKAKITYGDPDAGNSLDVAVAEIIAFLVTVLVVGAAFFFIIAFIALAI